MLVAAAAAAAAIVATAATAAVAAAAGTETGTESAVAGPAVAAVDGLGWAIAYAVTA